jgi:hypothetical protein
MHGTHKIYPFMEAGGESGLSNSRVEGLSGFAELPSAIILAFPRPVAQPIKMDRRNAVNPHIGFILIRRLAQQTASIK